MRRAAGWHRSFAGILVVLLGVGFLLQNLTDFEIDWGVVWPVVLIVLGVVNLPSSRWLGALLVVVGAAFLVDNLDVIDVDIGDFWPVVLVVVGLLNPVWRPCPLAAARTEAVRVGQRLLRR